MGYEAINSNEIQVGKPVSQPLMQKIKDNFDYLYGKIGVLPSSGLQNPSFEIDSDNDGIPDNWSRDLYPGGSGSFEETDVKHGSKAYKFIHPGGAGNGGGYLTSDYILATDTTISFSFYLKTTNASIKVKCEIRCYDKDKNYLSSVIVYESTNNPTSWEEIQCGTTLPSNTRYIKIRLHGGVDDTDEAGTVYFDYVRLETKHKYKAGDCIEAASDEETLITSTSIMKVKEIYLTQGGDLRISFAIKNNGANGKTYGRIYKNGTAIGTLRETSSTTYVTFTEDISGWKKGDLVQLYVYRWNYDGYCKNFRIKVANPTKSTLTM